MNIYRAAASEFIQRPRGEASRVESRRGTAERGQPCEQNSREFHWPVYREARFVPGSELRVFSVAESAARFPAAAAAAAGCGFRATGGGVRANSTAVPLHCFATRRAATGDATKGRIILVVGLLDTGNTGPLLRESFPACRRKHSSLRRELSNTLGNLSWELKLVTEFVRSFLPSLRKIPRVSGKYSSR